MYTLCKVPSSAACSARAKASHTSTSTTHSPMAVMPAAGVAQAAAGAREPAAAHGAADPPLRDLVESYAQEAGMEFLPKARLHEGLQVSA